MHYKYDVDEKLDIEKAEAKEVIELINGGYYIEIIQQLRKELSNVRAGNPIYDNGPIYTGSERDRMIISLEQQIDNYSKILEEFSYFARNMNDSLYNLNEIVNEISLQRAFEQAMFDLIGHKFGKNNNDILTESYEKFKKKTSKVSYKQNRQSQKTSRKISKEIYVKLKRNSKFTVNVEKFKINNASGNTSIKDLILQTRYEMENLFYNYFQEQLSKNNLQFDLTNSKKVGLSRLGVNVSLLKQSFLEFDKKSRNQDGDFKIVNNEFVRENNDKNSTTEGIEAVKRLNKIKAIEKEYFTLEINYSDIEKLKRYYTDVIELSREVKGLEIVLEAFANTSFASSELYQETEKIKNTQEIKMKEIHKNAEQLYTKMISTSKLNVKSDLDWLYREVEKINYLLEKLSDQGRYDKMDELIEQRSKIIEKMEEILRANPSINPQLYGIKLGLEQKNYNVQQQQVAEKNSSLDSFEIQNDEQVLIDINADSYKETINKLNNDYYKIASNRTQYYQNYMVSSIRNPERNLTFLEYLKSINNGGMLDRLIKFEQMKDEILIKVYIEYKMKYDEEYWYNLTVFKRYCTNMSKIIKDLGGVNSVISEADIEMFIENKTKEATYSQDSNSKSM